MRKGRAESQRDLSGCSEALPEDILLFHHHTPRTSLPPSVVVQGQQAEDVQAPEDAQTGHEALQSALTVSPDPGIVRFVLRRAIRCRLSGRSVVRVLSRAGVT